MPAKNRVAAAAAVLMFTFAAPAFAEPTPVEREQARALMDDGDKKRDVGDMQGALERYKAADAIMNVPTTALEVARAQASIGQLIEARETLGRISRAQPHPNEPPPFTAARKTAETMGNELLPRIPSLQIAIAGAEAKQTRLTLDNEPLAPAQFGNLRKINPGKHVIVARSGGLEKREEFTLPERESRTITVDFTTAVPPEQPKPAVVAPTSATPKILIYGGFGLAIVGVGVGAVTGILSITQTSSIKDECEGKTCPSSKQSDIDSATMLGNVSTVAFIAGGVGAAVGVVGLLLNRSEKRSSAFYLQPSAGGLSGTF